MQNGESATKNTNDRAVSKLRNTQVENSGTMYFYKLSVETLATYHFKQTDALVGFLLCTCDASE
jgi:hypothetical protein